MTVNSMFSQVIKALSSTGSQMAGEPHQVWSACVRVKTLLLKNSLLW